MPGCKKISVCVAVWLTVFLGLPRTLWAAPYFYIYGDATASAYVNQTWIVGMYSDGETLTAAQAVITFDEDLFESVQLSNLNSRCSYWAPADPSLGFGTGTTPYIKFNTKIVMSCGFSNPGYISTDGNGDIIMSFTLKPLVASGSASFVFSDTQFRFIGQTIAPGLSPDFDLTFNDEGTPSPTPTPVPSPTPTPVVDYLRASDINTVDLGAGASTRSSAARTTTTTEADSSDSVLSPVIFDDTIPPPPADLVKRDSATPYPISTATHSGLMINGEVLSLQSLRELFIPGKSTADKTLVLFNFLLIITFLVLLAILVWKLIVSRRTNSLKYRHMNEILEGELAVIESKIEGVEQGVVEGEDITKSLEELKQELEAEI